MNENIRNYWATQELLDYGYKLVIKRSKKSAKVIIKFNDGEIYTQFKIEQDNIMGDEMCVVYDEWNDDITDYLDYTSTIDDCIKGCVCRFITCY